MSNQQNDVWPVLKPMKLPETAKYDYGVWFILSDITGTSNEEVTQTAKASTGSKLKSWFKESIPNATFGSSGDLLVVPISMSKGELENHFAVDEESGEYLPAVKETEGGRQSWLKNRYDEQQPKARKIREVSGYAVRANSAYAPAGGLGVGGVGLAGM